jgi:hypothetical protein
MGKYLPLIVFACVSIMNSVFSAFAADLVTINLDQFVGNEPATISSTSDPALFTLDPSVASAELTAVNPCTPIKNDNGADNWFPTMTPPVPVCSDPPGYIQLTIEPNPDTQVQYACISFRTQALFASNPSSFQLKFSEDSFSSTLVTISLASARTTSVGLTTTPTSDPFSFRWIAGNDFGEFGGGEAGFTTENLVVSDTSCPPPPTLTVTNTNDSGPGSLRDTIAIIDPGGTVDFDPSLANQAITLTTGEIIIDKDVTIMGLGPNTITISAGNNGRIFNIQNANVGISDLKIADGLESCIGDACDARGGAILYSSGNLTLALNNCIFDSNDVSCNGDDCNAEGGAIWNGGGLATITANNCLFDSNTARCEGNNCDAEGGAIWNGGGLVNIEVNLSTFDFNSSTCEGIGCDALGGVIWNGGGGISESPLIIEVNNSTFDSNPASCDGDGCSAEAGAIWNGGGLVNIEVNNSTFSSNPASCEGIECGAEGGAIWNGGGLINIEVNASTLNSNSVTCNGDGCDAEGGAIWNGGGGISESPLIIGVNNSTFNSNLASCEGNECGAEGGAIWNGGGLVNIEVNNCTLNSNSASCTGIMCSELGDSIAALAGTLILECSIFNTNSPVGNCTGSNDISSLGNNIDNGATCIDGSVTGDKPNTDPGLDPAGLEENEGPTQTIALLPDSAAIDMCSSSCPPPFTDQRGVFRPIDGDGDDIAVCDIGAFELEAEVNGDEFAPGDANGDGEINILDVTVILNDILEISSAPGNGDCNEDGEVDILDVTCVLNIIFEG